MYLDQALSADPFEEACEFQLLHEQKVLPGPTGDRRHRRETARLFCGSEPGNGRSWKAGPGSQILAPGCTAFLLPGPTVGILISINSKEPHLQPNPVPPHKGCFLFPPT